MTPEHLSLDEGKTLVKLARQAIINYLDKHQLIKASEGLSERLLRKSGVFVTLNTTKPIHELRGCIGFPYPDEPLVNATIKAAVYAATDDPRFEPVTLEEFQESVTVEITVLTPPIALETNDRKKLPDMIEIGRHGLIVEGMGTSGLLLPQVATEWKWDASEFLMNCCLKAGLPPDSWLLNEVKVKTFEGEIFEEIEPAGEVRRKPIGET
jgi:uncharacterized protein (TIGR00296 family)